MLSRRLQTAASCSRLMRSSSHSNQPVRAQIAVHDDAPDVVDAELVRDGPRPARIGSRGSCSRGSNTSPGRPPRSRVSIWPAGSGSGRNGKSTRRWSVVTSPSASSHSPCVRVSSVPSGPRSVSRVQPLMFWPRSTTYTPGPGLGDRRPGRARRRARTGGASYSTSGASGAAATTTGSHARVVEAGEQHRWIEAASILGLAGDQIGAHDVRRRAAPPVVGARRPRSPSTSSSAHTDVACPTGPPRASRRSGHGTIRRPARWRSAFAPASRLCR